MTKDLKEDDMASNPPETPVSAGHGESVEIGTISAQEDTFNA